ncbi:MAG: STAS domain-containing protein [Dongiaceae bacterium]
MELHEETLETATVLSPQGRIDSSNAKDFEEALISRVQDGRPAILLDLAELRYISSAGLRVILLAAKQQRGKQGKFALCALTTEVREVFEVSGFGKILDIHPGRAEALATL